MRKTFQDVTPRRGRPTKGDAVPASERMRQMRARRKAAGLKTVSTWVPATPVATATYSPHRVLEARSLAMHAVIAQKIQRDPRLLEIARNNIKRWETRSQGQVPSWLKEWKTILDRPWPQIAALLTEQSDNAVRLRQSTPFAGVLTSNERRRIYEAFRA